MNNKKIAIAADNPEAYSQTFVLNHINHLADGNTAIILTKKKKVKTQKPTFVYDQKETLFEKLKRFSTNLKKLKTQDKKKQLDSQLKQFIEKENIGFVLAEFGYVGIRIFEAVAKCNIPMFFYFRGADASRKLTDQEYVHKLKAMVPKIDGLIAVSESLIKNLKNIGIEHPNTHIIPSGVDINLFTPKGKQEFLLASVGRFVKKKSPQITIQAFAKVVNKFPNARLEMVGEGELLNECIRLARTLGINKNITFHGPKDHIFVKKLLAEASLFIQHSVTTSNGETEGMPTAIQEAMASGCVVVATKHSGIPEHIKDGINGLIVNEGDLSAYTEKIIDVLSSKKTRVSIAKNARSYAIKNFDRKLNYSNLENIISSYVKNE